MIVMIRGGWTGRSEGVDVGRGRQGVGQWAGGQRKAETGMAKREGVEVRARVGSGEGAMWRVRLGGGNGEEEGGSGKGEMGRGQQEGGEGEMGKGEVEKKGQEERGFHRWI